MRWFTWLFPMYRTRIIGWKKGSPPTLNPWRVSVWGKSKSRKYGRIWSKGCRTDCQNLEIRDSTTPTRGDGHIGAAPFSASWPILRSVNVRQTRTGYRTPCEQLLPPEAQ